MPKQVHLSVKDVSLSFGGTKALTNVSFDVYQGEILAIIGPNGAGKTSMLNCMTGFYRPDVGSIKFEGHEITTTPAHKIASLGIARTFQNIALYTGLSTLDNIMAARHIHFKYGLRSAVFYLISRSIVLESKDFSPCISITGSSVSFIA